MLGKHENIKHPRRLGQATEVMLAAVFTVVTGYGLWSFQALSVVAV